MRTKKDKPTAAPLAVTLRAAIASDWRTLAALDVLAGDPSGTRRHRVHAALNELRAAGVVFEERTSKGVAEVRELPPVADGATCPACRAVVREHDDHHGWCAVGIRDCSWWAERVPLHGPADDRPGVVVLVDDLPDPFGPPPGWERDGTDEDHAAACGPRIVPSAETMATVRALVGEPDAPSPLDALKDRAAALGRPLGASEGFALLAEGLNAPAPPVDQAAPVEAPSRPVNALSAHLAAMGHVEEAREVAGLPPAPKGPGPSSRCAVCGIPYRAHGIADMAGHPFTPKPRGRPCAPALPPVAPIPNAATAILPRRKASKTRGPVVSVDGGRVERSRADVLTAQTDPYRVEVDPVLATEASMRAEAERQKAATHDARVEAIEGVAAALARAAAEPETSRGEAPGEQDHATRDTDPTRPSGSNRVPALRVATPRAPGKPRVPRPRAHPVPSADGVDQIAERVGAKDVATAGDVARPCRPPLCHADDIHEPSRVRGFARPLCEAHRRWVEGAGGTLAAGGLAGVV